VEVAPIVEREVVTKITLVGTAEPWLETVVAAEEPGLVKRMLVDEGDSIQKDQVLCAQDVSQITLRIKSAKAQLAEAQVQQAQAQREWERQKRLFEDKTVSEKSYEDAQFARDAAREKVLRLQSELKVLQDQARKKIIRAPVSGYVVERHALIGQWLDPGYPVVTIVVPDPIRVLVSVPERYVPFIEVGAEARVLFDALPGESFQGTIAAVIPRADRAARTFPVRVEIPNPAGTIKAGMLARPVLPVGNPHQATLVPKDALVLSSSGTVVFVVNDNTAHQVPVALGPSHDGYAEVQGDLPVGGYVVVRGNERLQPGQGVQVMDRTELKEAPATQ
jgi:membrane fusion protein (multidrug efflux system)